MKLRVENGKLRMNVSSYADIFKFYRVSDTLILNSEFSILLLPMSKNCKNAWKIPIFQRK